MFGWIKVSIARLLLLGLLPGSVWGAPDQRKQNPDRPTLPYSMLGPRRDDVDAYDSKAEPVARATQALMKVNQTGWELIHKYYPTLGMSVAGPEKKVHPEDRANPRFFASFVNEDPTFSSMPLLCMVWSLPEVSTLRPAEESARRINASHGAGGLFPMEAGRVAPSRRQIDRHHGHD